MAEVKVYLYASENDNYVELWKVIKPEKGKPKYYGRYTYNDEGTWYYISDPLGYCELDYPVKEDVMFICCDSKGNEYCRYSNAYEHNPLPRLKTVIQREWAKHKGKFIHNTEDETSNFFAEAWNGDTTMKINQWLLSFKDPDLYAKEINDMYGYDENWTGVWHEREIDYEPLSETEFEYMGHKYQFTKVKHKHDVCGVEWYEFVCTDSPYTISDLSNEDRPWINTYGYMGNWFDNTTYGTMYDKRTARQMVIRALREIFASANGYQKLYVLHSQSYPSIVAYKMTFEETANDLINGNLHRNEVDKLCKEIRKKTKDKVFVANMENRKYLKEKYPELYIYNGDWR